MINKEPFSGEKAREKALEGKDDWNAWAAEHEGREVDFSGVDFTTRENKDIFFAGFIFPGPALFMGSVFESADFKGVEFSGNTDFSDTKFNGKEVSFKDAIFNGKEVSFKKAKFNCETVSFKDAIFSGIKLIFKFATFSGKTNEFKGTTFNCKKIDFTRVDFVGGGVSFTDAKFIGGAVRFSGAIFDCPVSMDNATFAEVPDFRRTFMKAHFTLKGVKVSLFRGKAKDELDADRLRRLKQMAADAMDHDRAQEFFALELMAKRGHETRGWALIPSYLYETTSNFGRRLMQPTFFLALTWFLFGLAFAEGSGKPGMGLNGFLYSLNHLLRFLPGSQNRLTPLGACLFGETVPDVISILTMVEGVLGVFFIFLFGLALRNRFRI